VALFKKKGFAFAGVKKQWNLRGSQWMDESIFQLIFTSK
jgi:hypothetical protein